MLIVEYKNESNSGEG